MYNASDRKDIRRAEKEAAAAESERLGYLKAAMTVPQGRQWFHDLLEACHLFSDPFTGDPLREAYSKGERNVGLLIYSDIVTHCPDDFVKMMKEAHGRRLSNDTTRNRDTDSASAGERPDEQDPGWDLDRSVDYTAGGDTTDDGALH